MPPEPRMDALVGTVLEGAYRITRLIGEGGMGAVYEAMQLRLNKRVAIKLMARDLASNREARSRAISLIATRLLSRSCMASYTAPIPPSPIRRVMRYAPSSTVPTSASMRGSGGTDDLLLRWEPWKSAHAR